MNHWSSNSLHFPQLPKSNSTSVAFLTVMVKGETQQFRSRKSVLVKNSESLVFVQTDKPIYKPGQTGTGNWVDVDSDSKKTSGLHSSEDSYFHWSFQTSSWGELQPTVNLTSFSWDLGHAVPLSLLLSILQAEHLIQMAQNQTEAQMWDDFKAQSPLAALESTEQNKHSQGTIHLSQELIILSITIWKKETLN